MVLSGRTNELRRLHERRPYEILLSGIRLRVDVDVFPPDASRSVEVLSTALQQYHPRCALDMGCGTGYLALLLRKLGADSVYATDAHPPAVECTLKNVSLNPELSPVYVVMGDLFSGLPPAVLFDFIVFNQPLYPLTEAMFGMGSEGGRLLVQRFLRQVPTKISRDGVVLMPFRIDIPDEHDPARIASSMGFRVKQVTSMKTDETIHVVVEIKM